MAVNKTLTPAEENALCILEAEKEFIKKGYVSFYRLAAIKAITPDMKKEIMPKYNKGYLIGLFKGVYECVINAEKREAKLGKQQSSSCQTRVSRRRYTKKLLKESWIFAELREMVYVKKQIHLEEGSDLKRMLFDVEIAW